MKLFKQNWKENWKEKWEDSRIYTSLKSTRSFFKKIIRYTKKMYGYAIILWDDEDWDYGHIYKLLQYKIKRTRECIVKNDFIEGSKRIAKQIKYAEFLIDRILESNYLPELMEQHNKKWGESIHSFEKTENSDFLRLKTYRLYVRTEQDEIQERKEYIDIIHKQQEAEEKDKDRLFKHLRKYIERWWD